MNLFFFYLFKKSGRQNFIFNKHNFCFAQVICYHEQATILTYISITLTYCYRKTSNGIRKLLIYIYIFFRDIFVIKIFIRKK